MALTRRLEELRQQLQQSLGQEFQFDELENGELGVVQLEAGVTLAVKEIGPRMFVQFDMGAGVPPQRLEEESDDDLKFEARDAIEEMLEEEWDSSLYSLEDTVEWAPNSPEMKALRHLRWAAVEVNREVNSADEVLEIIQDLQDKTSWKEI